MPELPDVEIMKQYVDATSLHQKVIKININNDQVLNISPQTLRKHVEEKSFEKTDRVGKHLFLSAGADKWLMLHFDMTGNVHYSENKSDIPDHTRVTFIFSNESHLDYVCQRMFGRIDISDNPAQFCEEHNLGKDALSLQLEDFSKLLSNKRGMIKSALMDQSMIAGIGNIYSDEILYQSKVHPKTKAEDLSDEQLKKMHATMRRILKTAVNNRADPEKMPQHYLIGKRRQGRGCPDCGGKIKRIKISGCGCYICPECQKKYR